MDEWHPSEESVVPGALEQIVHHQRTLRFIEFLLLRRSLDCLAAKSVAPSSDVSG